MKASATSPAVRTIGGGAGSSRRPAASLTMASTTAPSTALVVARAVAGARATTAPGMPAASASSSFSSTSAGAQPTDTSTPRPSAERLVRRVGTTAPAATSRTPRRATRPIHVTLGLTSSTALLPLTATSQPSDSRTGMASASARAPDGSRTSGCRLQPTAGPPTASSRSARSSLRGRGGAPPAGPDHDLPVGPRGLQLDPAHDLRQLLGRGGAIRGREQLLERAEPGQVVLEVRDDPLPLAARTARARRPGWPRRRRAAGRASAATPPGRPPGGRAPQRWPVLRPPPTSPAPAVVWRRA